MPLNCLEPDRLAAAVGRGGLPQRTMLEIAIAAGPGLVAVSGKAAALSRQLKLPLRALRPIFRFVRDRRHATPPPPRG